MSMTLCCDVIAVHSHDGGKTMRRRGVPYLYRWSKTYRWPRVNTYIAATRRPFRIVRNRYGVGDEHPVTIGIALQVDRRVWSLRWADAHGQGYTPEGIPD